MPAGLAILNGYGKLAGSTQLLELGEIETPIVLTNTLGVGRAIEGVNRWILAQPGNERVGSVNAVVGETNDGRLNDIRAGLPGTEHVLAAIEAATDGPAHRGMRRCRYRHGMPASAMRREEQCVYPCSISRATIRRVCRQSQKQCAETTAM